MLCLTDNQKCYGQFLLDQGKRDDLASRSERERKANINGRYVFLHDTQPTKVDKWSLIAIKEIVLYVLVMLRT